MQVAEGNFFGSKFVVAIGISFFIHISFVGPMCYRSRAVSECHDFMTSNPPLFSVKFSYQLL